MTSTTSGARRADNELSFSIGTPFSTAILAAACNSASRVCRVDSFSGLIRCPLALRRTRVNNSRYRSISARRPAGNWSHGMVMVDLRSGSASCVCGHPGTVLLAKFQAFASSRREAEVERLANHFAVGGKLVNDLLLHLLWADGVGRAKPRKGINPPPDQIDVDRLLQALPFGR